MSGKQMEDHQCTANHEKQEQLQEQPLVLTQAHRLRPLSTDPWPTEELHLSPTWELHRELHQELEFNMQHVLQADTYTVLKELSSLEANFRVHLSITSGITRTGSPRKWRF